MTWQDELAESLEGSLGSQEQAESLTERLSKFGIKDIIDNDTLESIMIIAILAIGLNRPLLPTIEMCAEPGYRAGVEYCLSLTDEEKAALLKGVK